MFRLQWYSTYNYGQLLQAERETRPGSWQHDGSHDEARRQQANSKPRRPLRPRPSCNSQATNRATDTRRLVRKSLDAYGCNSAAASSIRSCAALLWQVSICLKGNCFVWNLPRRKLMLTLNSYAERMTNGATEIFGHLTG
jgi:hypothetical protein